MSAPTKAQAAAAARARGTQPVSRNRKPRAAARTLKPQPAWLPQQQTEFLIATLGSATKLAALLGVAKSQPSRWRRGEEVPGPDAARKLLDLDAVMRKAVLLWDVSVARIWLESPNAHLDQALPINVVLMRGAPEVLEALDDAFAGGFA